MVDYTRFEGIGAEEHEEEQAQLKEKRKKHFKSVQRGGGKLFKYVDSDGETVSDDEEDAREQLKMFEDDYGQGTIYQGNEEEENDDSDDEDDEELHPLFWNRLPKEGEKGYEVAKLMEDLIYKGDDDEDKTPNELAQDFKEKGNEFFNWGEKFYKRALKEYKEALQWARKGDGSESNRKCYASILSNRAAIQIKFKNYGSAIRDCKAAIEFGPDPLPNSKPFYRAGLASFRLGRGREADDFVKRGLGMDPENKVLKELEVKTSTLLAQQKKAKLAKDRADAKERKLDEEMRKTCLKFGIQVGPLLSDIQMYISNSVGNKTQGGFPRPTYEHGSMQWSALFLFPEKMQTDYVQSFDLTHTFRDHLSMMFPIDRTECPGPKVPPWDESFEYTVDSLEVYFEERQIQPFDMKKMWGPQYNRKTDKVDYSKKFRVKVGLDKSLLHVLADKSYVVPGVPTFLVVSNRSDFYRDTFCPQHDGRLRIL